MKKMTKGRMRALEMYEDIKDSEHLAALRDGTPLDKGVQLTEEYLEEHYEEMKDMIDYFIMYPDMFLDLIKPSDSNFELFFYQRIVLRAIMRYKSVYIVACRAFSKSFLTILALFLQCVFMPGTKRFICAPNKNQSAQIGREKLIEIYDKWPLLRREIVGGEVSETPGNMGKDYISLHFRNGSQFDVKRRPSW